MYSPLLISISVDGGHQAEGFRKLCPLGSSVIERWYVAPGVKRVSVGERGVQGTLFIPPGELFLSAWLFLALHVFAGFKGLPPAPCALVSRPRTLPGCAGHVGGVAEGWWSIAPPCWPPTVTSAWRWSISLPRKRRQSAMSSTSSRSVLDGISGFTLPPMSCSVMK